MDDESLILRRRLLSTISLKEKRISYLRHVALFLEKNRFVETSKVFREECLSFGYDLSYITPFEEQGEIRQEAKVNSTEKIKSEDQEPDENKVPFAPTVLDYSFDEGVTVNQLCKSFNFMHITRKKTDDGAFISLSHDSAESEESSLFNEVSSLTINQRNSCSNLSPANSKEANIVHNLYMFEKYADFMRQNVASDTNHSFNILDSKKGESNEIDMENQHESTEETGVEQYCGNSKMKIEILEENYNLLKSKFSNLQQDHNKLTAITAELATALQYDFKNDKSILKKTLDKCMQIYPELFLKVQTDQEEGENDEHNQDENKNDLDLSSLQSQNCSFSSENTLHVVTSKTYFELDYDKIKRDLLDSDSITKIKLLQALRWRLTKATESIQDVIIKSYVSNDILYLNLPYKNSEERNFKLLQNSFFPSSDKNEILLQQQIARFLNTLASLKLGRDYLTLDCTILKNIMLPLMVMNKPEIPTISVTEITEGMLIAIFQKFSLRINQRMCLIKEGFIEFFIEYLTIKMHVLTMYALEYGTALLMNLCLHEEAQNICAEAMKNETTHLIIALLNPKFMTCLPYVNGIIFSLLNNLQFYEHFKMYGLINILKAQVPLTKDEDKSQLEFLINRLSQSQYHKFPITSDKINDTEEEIDLLEAELDLNEPEMPYATSFSGERLLYENYLSAEVMKYASSSQMFNHPAIYHINSRHFVNSTKTINMLEVLREHLTNQDYLTIFDVNNKKKIEPKQSFENFIENLVKYSSPYIYWSICPRSGNAKQVCNRSNCFPFKSKRNKAMHAKASDDMNFMLAPRPDDSLSTTDHRPYFCDESSVAGGSKSIRKSSILEETLPVLSTRNNSEVNRIIESIQKENKEKNLDSSSAVRTCLAYERTNKILVGTSRNNSLDPSKTPDSFELNENKLVMTFPPVIIPPFKQEAIEQETPTLDRISEIDSSPEKCDSTLDKSPSIIANCSLRTDSETSNTVSKIEDESLATILDSIVHSDVSGENDDQVTEQIAMPESILKKPPHSDLEHVKALLMGDEISRSTVVSTDSYCRVLQPPNSPEKYFLILGYVPIYTSSTESSVAVAFSEIVKTSISELSVSEHSDSNVSTHTGSFQWKNSVSSDESKLPVQIFKGSNSTGSSEPMVQTLSTISQPLKEDILAAKLARAAENKLRVHSQVSEISSYPMKRNSNFTDLEIIDEENKATLNKNLKQTQETIELDERSEVIEILDNIIEATLGIVERFFHRYSIPIEKVVSTDSKTTGKPQTQKGSLMDASHSESKKRTSFKRSVEDLESKEQIILLENSCDESVNKSEPGENTEIKQPSTHDANRFNSVKTTYKKKVTPSSTTNTSTSTTSTKKNIRTPCKLYDVEAQAANKFNFLPKRRNCPKCLGVKPSANNEKYIFQVKSLENSTLIVECTNPSSLAEKIEI